MSSLFFSGVVTVIISYLFLVLGAQQDIREPFKAWKVNIPFAGLLIGMLIMIVGRFT